jgi:hypothetical protein
MISVIKLSISEADLISSITVSVSMSKGISAGYLVSM